MAITISGENNNDRILAQDGVIDQISGINIVGLITASHINVGSNIQLGNAGIITATTFVGNVTGNVNSTSPLLLQTGGSERIRLTSNNEIGIAGANYGSSGQVLTSGGSGSAVSWTTIAGTTINNNANNRIITGSGTANTLEAETSLEWNGTDTLTVVHPSSYQDFIVRTTAGGSSFELFRSGNGPFRIRSASTSPSSEADELVIGATNSTRGLTIFGETNNIFFGDAGDNDIGKIQYVHSDNSMRFTTNTSERLRIASDGNLTLGNSSFGSGLGQLRIINDASSAPASLALFGHNNTNDGDPFAQIQFAEQESGTAGQIKAKIEAQAVSTNERGADLVFSTAANSASSTATERLRIHDTGEVHFYGNQTSAPEGDFGFRWDRNSSVNFQITNTNNTSVNAGAKIALKANVGNIALQYVNNGGFYINNSVSGYIHYYSGGTSRLYIDTSGNVTINNAGTIGTSNGGVGKRFGIKSNANNIIVGETESASNFGLILESRVSGRSGDARSSQIGLGNGLIDFYTAAAGAGVTKRLEITSSGKVKIFNHGSNNQRSLSVLAPKTQIQWGTAEDVGGFLMSENNGQFGLSGGGYWTGSNWVATHTGSAQIRHDGGGTMVFCTNASLTSGNNFTPTERLRINSSGNVMIGRTGGQKQLSVRKVDNSSGVHIVQTIGGNNHVSGYAVGLGFDPEGYEARTKMAIVAEGTSSGYSRGKLHFLLDGVNDSGEATLSESRMSIDDSGRVVKPQQPGFGASQMNGWTNTTGSTYAVTSYNIVHHNYGSDFNSSNGRFTAPVDGRYLMTAIGMGIPVSNPHIAFGINNSSNGGGPSRGGTDYGNNNMWSHPSNAGYWVCLTHILDLSANDYVRVYTYDWNSSSDPVRCYFYGYLLG